MNLSTPSLSISAAQLEVVRQQVSRCYGFWMKEEWLEQLRGKVALRMKSVGATDFSSYWRLIHSPDVSSPELQELVEEILNHESQFNRNPEQLLLLRKQVLLDWRHDPIKHPKRIASLGCSTGEEAYSLATLVEQVLGDKADDVLILGMDVSRRALNTARQARYNEFRIRDVPEGDRAKYFTRDGEEWVVQPRLQKRVRFVPHNLVQPLTANFLDVIFCCNVLIYFPPVVVQGIIQQFHAALKPHGHLFLGHADSFVPRSDLFQPVTDVGATCYVRRPASEMKAVSTAEHNLKPQRINLHESVCQ